MYMCCVVTPPNCALQTLPPTLSLVHMSKPTLDSDLYGDIYGDDDTDYTVPLHDAEELIEPKKGGRGLSDHPPSSVIESSSPKRSATGNQDTFRSLPAKPMSPGSGSLSYSAQIAQQFSAYQQTPSQERQLRTDISLPQRTSSTLPTKANPSTTSTTDSVFGKKPSEMHDAG